MLIGYVECMWSCLKLNWMKCLGLVICLKIDKSTCVELDVGEIIWKC